MFDTVLHYTLSMFVILNSLIRVNNTEIFT